MYVATGIHTLMSEYRDSVYIGASAKKVDQSAQVGLFGAQQQFSGFGFHMHLKGKVASRSKMIRFCRSSPERPLRKRYCGYGAPIWKLEESF